MKCISFMQLPRTKKIYKKEYEEKLHENDLLGF